VLRGQLLLLEREVAALTRDKSRIELVTQLALGLLVELTAHTRLEDDVLAPTLREIDAWGPVRANMLLEHHDQQRKDLERLLQLYAHLRDPGDIANITLELIADIRADMRHEEQSLLSPTLLRDDVIAVAMEAG
jgi:hypothetical protein